MVPSCSGAYRVVHEVREKLKTCDRTTLFCRIGRYEEKREADSDAGGDSERLGGLRMGQPNSRMLVAATDLVLVRGSIR